MTDRMIDLAETPVRLSVRNSLLVIRHNENEETTVPLAELAVVVVSHPSASLTHAVLTGLAEAGATFVACDRRHMPAAMLLPLQSHFVQGERFARQAGASLPLRKRLWRDIVSAKVRAQGRVLVKLRGNDGGLPWLAARVRSGDPQNIEAQASRRYWPMLFAHPDFRRDPHAGGQNHLLNYGYAILRAIIARAICAAGLHPSLGLHHHNRYDAFRLADDLMEPFRPIVDRAVAHYSDEHGPGVPLDKEAKQVLLRSLTERFTVEGESRTLFDIAGRTASSLAAVYAGDRKNLALPEL